MIANSANVNVEMGFFANVFFNIDNLIILIIFYVVYLILPL